MANKQAITLELGVQNAQLIAGLNQAKGELQKFSNVARSLAGWAAGMFGTAELINGLKSSYLAAEESAKVQRVLEATLKATGYASGMVGDEMASLAEKLMDISGVDDEVIKGAESLLVTFRNIGKDVFPEAMQAAMDMSTVMGSDLNSAVLQLGKALNDPIQGVTALRRVGVQFTAQQKEQIEALVKNNQGLEAQKIILNELVQEFGGATAAGKTATKTLQTAIGEMQESFGNFLDGGVGSKLMQWLIDTAKGWEFWANKVRIATSSINELSMADLNKKRAENWVKQEKVKNTKDLFGRPSFGAQEAAELNRLEKEDAAITARMKALDKKKVETLKNPTKKNFNLDTEDKGKKETSIKIGKETIGYSDITTDFNNQLAARNTQINEETALIKRSLAIQKDLMKNGTNNQFIEYKEALALRVDELKRTSEIEQRVAEETKAKKLEIEKKVRDDILSFSSGTATNKDEAIRVVKAKSAIELALIEKSGKEKLKLLLESNKKLTAEKIKFAEAEGKLDSANFLNEKSKEHQLQKIDDIKQLAEIQNNADLETLKFHEQIGMISKEQELQGELDLIEKKKAIDLKYLDDKIKILTEYGEKAKDINGNALTPEQIQANKDAIEKASNERVQIEKQADVEIAASRNTLYQEQHKFMLEYNDAMKSEYKSVLSSILQGNESLGSSFKLLVNAMKKHWADGMADMIVNYASMAAKTYAGNNQGGWISNILGVLGFGGGGGSSSGGGLPSSFASQGVSLFGGGFNVPAFHSGGTVNIPTGKQMLAMLRGGEQVLNPSEAANYRGQKSNNTPITINNVYAPQVTTGAKAEDVLAVLQKHSREFIGVVNDGIQRNIGGIRTAIKAV